MIKFNSIHDCNENEITFLDNNDYEYSIKDVESLFLELIATDDIIEPELISCLKHMSVEDFLKEFKSEFENIMIGFAQFYPKELERLSTKN